jgi:GrpB-like predicted nucleotidyltransferase (UPF0157 family)
MEKSLSEMSLEELWQLFPIILEEHNPAYKEWYLAEKEKILECIKGINIARVSHIGSTAVPGLTAKPTVDILLEVFRDCNLAELKGRLINSGWLLMSSVYKPDLKLAFNKGYTPKGFAEKVYHLHVRYYSDWDELYFRDYLIAHKDVADKYGKLKLNLWKRYEHNRDGYTEAKTQFIKKYTELARTEMGNKYSPEYKPDLNQSNKD